MTRDEFRKAVFARDGGICVICKADAADAHHILERRLWPDGGYHLDNGASVCSACHLLCEATEISVEYVRNACSIANVSVPPQLDPDTVYDKWGNPILPNGTRLRGELFHDENVQKILGQHGMLHLFTHWVKYPRTHHLPWSQNVDDGDCVMDSTRGFSGNEVVVTEKMDGGNITMYSDHIHARTLSGCNRPEQSWVKRFWDTIRRDIPEHWRVCGENLYARHSIGYDDLPSYFLGFSIWDHNNTFLSWDDTLEWMDLIGIIPVKTLYRGPYDPDTIRGLWDEAKSSRSEGYVVRISAAFPAADFRRKVGKFVRRHHVTTANHWSRQIERNSLGGSHAGPEPQGERGALHR